MRVDRALRAAVGDRRAAGAGIILELRHAARRRAGLVERLNDEYLEVRIDRLRVVASAPDGEVLLLDTLPVQRHAKPPLKAI